MKVFSKKVFSKLAGATLLVGAMLVAGAVTASADDTVMHNAVKHAEVRLALLENVGIDALRIDIDVDGNSVDLSGTVRQRSTIELAKRIVESVEGVDDVDVKLDIAPQSDEGAMDEAAAELSDAMLEAKVKVALLGELGIDAFGIEVESADGVVALSGKVDEEQSRHAAVETTKDVAGVKEVRDLMKIAQS